MDKLAAYYAQRAAEYERFYAKPERQADHAILREKIPALLTGRRVLEIACGTGYWTEVIAKRATELVALDLNEEVLEIARTKPVPSNRVRFVRGSAYDIPDFGRRHDALFAGFWWSHVLLKDLDRFLASATKAVAPGALLVFLDNRYVEGSSTPVSRRDAEGNTYQARKLDDGSAHEVLKNFPADDELLQRALRHGVAAHVDLLEHYWLLSFQSPN